MRIEDIKESDRFRVALFTDPDTGGQAVVKVHNWNPSFVFCSHLGTVPPVGGPCRPQYLEWIELPVFTLTECPKDYPGQWVIRCMEAKIPQLYVGDPWVFNSLALARSWAVAALGGRFVWFDRSECDDPVILGCWI